MTILSLLSAFLFSTLCLGAAIFQFLLAAGKPWGEYAMGGKNVGVLPVPFRVYAVFQGCLLLWFSALMLAKTNLFPELLFLDFKRASAVLFGFSLVSAIMNSITPSKKERAIWAPVGWMLTLSSGLVLFS